MTITDPDLIIAPATPDDRAWIAPFIEKHWSAPFVIAHGRAYRPAELPGFKAMCWNKPLGLVTYEIIDLQCEIVTLNAVAERMGIGTKLLEAAIATARNAGCHRVWLITTNDNLNALKFYQKRGWRLVTIHRNALDVSRRMKPQIPIVGDHGIPLRDEIELEFII